LSPNDLLRDFSESPVTPAPGQRERLWSKVLSDTRSGCLARFGVNKKRLLWRTCRPGCGIDLTENGSCGHASRRAHWHFIEYWEKRQGFMSATKRGNGLKRRGQSAKAQSVAGLAEVARAHRPAGQQNRVGAASAA